MRTVFNKKETIKLIEEYYEKLEGRKVEVSISAKTEPFGLYETMGCKTTIKVAETVDLAGMKKSVDFVLSEDELFRILKALFSLYEYDVKGVDIDDGVNSSYEGYGMCEHVVNRAYFKGIIVNLEKEKNVGLKKQFS